jgi:hypothetical protein
MAYANISAALAALDKSDILTKINDIDTLLVFLINLTSEERQDLRKAGTKREGLVVGTYSLALNNSGAIPSSFSMAEWTKDEKLVIDLRDIRSAMVQVVEGIDLRDIRSAMVQIVEGIDDTILALGVERLAQAESALRFLEEAGKTNAQLNTAVQALKQVYAGQGVQAPLPLITVPAGGSVVLEKLVVGRLFVNKGTTVLAVNKAGSVNPATVINVDPNSSFKITADYKNVSVTNLSPSQAGTFTAKTQSESEIVSFFNKNSCQNSIPAAVSFLCKFRRRYKTSFLA